ncbi:MAG: hypothetical protein GX575_02175 [Candidatus Anammoximicrobium sp.]|nr:hypothetical protein [Candidatus Anammoximicrobium sp.]
MNAVDAKVLICAQDRRDPRKQALAVSLSQPQASCVLRGHVAAGRGAVLVAHGNRDSWTGHGTTAARRG